MAKKIQKNLWLPPALVRQLDSVVKRLNQVVEPKTGQSELMELALRILLEGGDAGVRELLRAARMRSFEPEPSQVGTAPDADAVADDVLAPPPADERGDQGNRKKRRGAG